MSNSDKKKPNRRDFILTATTAAAVVAVNIKSLLFGFFLSELDIYYFNFFLIYDFI